MKFTGVSSTVAAVIGLASTVLGHGHIRNSINQEVDVRITDAGVNSCGVQLANSVSAFLNGSRNPFMMIKGAENELTYRMTNSDGAGPLSVAIDPSCTGDSFSKQLEVKVQVPGENGILNDPALPKDFKFNVTLPSDLKCDCNLPNVCLMRVITPTQFTSCIFIAPIEKAREFNNFVSFQQGPGRFGMAAPQGGIPRPGFNGAVMQQQFGMPNNRIGAFPQSYGMPQQRAIGYYPQNNQFQQRQYSQYNQFYNRQQSMYPRYQQQRGFSGNNRYSGFQRSQFPVDDTFGGF